MDIGKGIGHVHSSMWRMNARSNDAPIYSRALKCDHLATMKSMARRPMGRTLVAFLLSAWCSIAGAAPPTLFIAGDSTAAKYTGANPQQGWAEPAAKLFDPAKLRVVNAARGGRSSRTFITEGHWDRMLADVKAGDFVIIQFGHNDDGALNQEPPGSSKPLRARGTIPGVGDEYAEIDNVITGKHETVYTFGYYLRKMVADTRAKSATPVLMTLTERNHWHDGRIDCPSDTYRSWTWRTARDEKVAFVDLTRVIADRYQRQGEEAVRAQFGSDAVHTNLAGAEANAADVVAGLRTLRGLKFDSKLSAAGKQVEADQPLTDSACPKLN
jgi:lysophospholipase L1-like esterase